MHEIFSVLTGHHNHHHYRYKNQECLGPTLPTPVFLPGESQGQGRLVGCRLWGRTELDMTEATQQQQQQGIGLILFKELQMVTIYIQGQEPIQYWDATRTQNHCNHLSYSRFSKPYNWRRPWHPTPVLLPGKSHGWRSVVGCSPWGR